MARKTSQVRNEAPSAALSTPSFDSRSWGPSKARVAIGELAEKIG